MLLPPGKESSVRRLRAPFFPGALALQQPRRIPGGRSGICVLLELTRCFHPKCSQEAAAPLTFTHRVFLGQRYPVAACEAAPYMCRHLHADDIDSDIDAHLAFCPVAQVLL